MNIIEKGVYEAYQGNSEMSIAIDEYTISRMSDGYHVESNSTVLGISGFQQRAILLTDDRWQMQELRITIESLDVEMTASLKEGRVYVHQKQPESDIEKIIDLQNDRHFFIFNGALLIPMIWLRGFDFSNFEKATYQMLPVGYAEVKQLHNTDRDC